MFKQKKGLKVAKKLIKEELKRELITGAGAKSKTVMKDKDESQYKSKIKRKSN